MRFVAAVLLLAACGCSAEPQAPTQKAFPHGPDVRPRAEVLHEHPSSPHALGETDWRVPAIGEEP